jgi:predicted nucleic acid-binding protein
LSIITFLDSSVLIAAHKGRPPHGESALRIINDSSRAFIVSPFLYLETVPMAIHFKKEAEIAFFKAYFEGAHLWVNDLEEMVRVAQEESERHGLAAMDALHVAAAYLGKADVFLALEKKTKPMYRTSLIRVAYL